MGRLLWRVMCKRDTPLMFNFLQTLVLIHLHQGQGKVLTEVFMREAESENTLQRVMFARVRESRQSNVQKKEVDVLRRVFR